MKSLLRKKIISYSLLSLIFVSVFLFLPGVGLAQEDVDLVRCGGNGEPQCTTEDFFDLLARVMRWGFRLAVALAALMFAYGGFLLMSSFGRPAQISKAKGIFIKGVVGIIIMFVAYSGVWFVLTRLGVNQEFYQFL